jgi:putative ABC transport system ATP-binding protein
MRFVRSSCACPPSRLSEERRQVEVSIYLNILGGLDVPSDGALWFGEQRLDGADGAALTAYRREHVGFAFQFYNLIPGLTVRENVALVTDIARDPMLVDDAVAQVGLAERADHLPAQLSGGEQQRVAIARAIVKPEVLRSTSARSTRGLRIPRSQPY